LIASDTGVCSAYGIHNLEKLGNFFVEPGTTVYPGMVIGEAIKDKDMDINPTKKKEVTNIRTVLSDEKLTVRQARLFGIEDAISYLREDEYVEVTPKTIRIRKQILDKSERERENKKGKNKK